MARARAKQAAKESASPRVDSGNQTSANEVFPVSNPITSFPERTETTLTQRAFGQLIFQFGIREADELLPGKN